jgi:hypothetical protein
VGQNYYFELDGRLGGTADRYGPTAHPLAGQSLLSTAKPGLFGTARVGSALHATAGSWDLAPTGYSYQWFRDGHPVAGAAAGTHLLTASDRGHRLSVSVTVSAPGMISATATSTSSALVGVAPALRRPPHVPYLSGKS